MSRGLLKKSMTFLMTFLLIVAYTQYCSAFNMKLNANERLLVFAPHPDDEALGCSGLMQRVKALGGTVDVVYMTAGDGCVTFNPCALFIKNKIHRGMGYQRMSEALLAMTYLNISKEHIAFLGYPDQGLMPLWKSQAEPYQGYRSKITGADRVFYMGSECQGLSYDFDSLMASLRLVIERAKPTLILIPAAWDNHFDHRATNYFVKRVLSSKKYSGRIFSYLIHYKSWPSPQKKRGFYEVMQVPRKLPANRYDLWLVPSEYQCKMLAIKAYHTQYPKINRNMISFVRGNEVFWQENSAPSVHIKTMPYFYY